MYLPRRAVLGAAAASAACAAWKIPAVDLAALENRIAGRIITPKHADYDRERRTATFNPRVEAYPAAIVLCASAADVARTIGFARDREMEIAIRAGGHDMQAASTCNGIVADVRALDHIEVDAERRSVRVGAGVRAGALSRTLASHGLAAALGCDHRVGVAGLTLGGGLGWLIGRHGAACDNLTAATLVTADGRLVRASREENPDLFWGLRGGGGNFGVATELTLAADPLGDVVQGAIVYAAVRPAEFLRFFRDYVAGAGSDIDYELFILPRPAPTAFLKVCFSGSPGEANRVLAPLLAYGPPLADTLARSAYTGSVELTGAAGALFSGASPSPPRRPDDAPGFIWSGFSAAPLSDAAIDAISAHLAQAEGRSWSFGCGYVVHGAAVVGPELSAQPRRDGQISFFFGAGWRRAEEAAAQMNWVDRSRAAVGRHCGPTYINFIGDGDQRTIEAAYGDNYPRLQRLKQRYDPSNVFRLNRNIAP